jgi:hypothetical protein
MDTSFETNVIAQPELIEQAIKCKQRAIDFLTRSRKLIPTATLPMTATEIGTIADEEARLAVNTGDGSIPLDSNFCTPRMRGLVYDVSGERLEWISLYRDHVAELMTRKTELDRLLDKRLYQEPRRLNALCDAKIQELRSSLISQPIYKDVADNIKTMKPIVDQLRAYNSGRSPKRVSQFAYITILVLIGAGEWAVNYQTFLDKFPPVLAVSATALVALIVAISSHYHGIFLKQYKYLIPKNREEIDRKANRRNLRLISLFLILVLLFVFWARYSYLADKYGLDVFSDNYFGDKGYGILATAVGPTMFLNIMIWFIGLILSWALHEKIPNLRETSLELKKLEGELRDLSAASEADIVRAKDTLAEDLAANRKLASEEEILRDELVTLEGQLTATNRNYHAQHAAKLSAALSEYAREFSAAVMRREGDDNLVLHSQIRGSMTLSDFTATNFEIKEL